MVTAVLPTTAQPLNPLNETGRNNPERNDDDGAQSKIRVYVVMDLVEQLRNNVS